MATLGYIRFDDAGTYRTAASPVYLHWGYDEEVDGYSIGFGMWPRPAHDLARGGTIAWWIYCQVTFWWRPKWAKSWLVCRVRPGRDWS